VLSLIIDKGNLLQKSNSPKIVLIGGSNLMVGIDSSQINKTFRYNVINMGHYGGFGISIFLYKSLEYLKPDDIVIISPEYLSIYDDYKLEPFSDIGIKWMLAYSPMLTIKHVYLKRCLKDIPRHFAELVSEKAQTLITCSLKGRFASSIGHGILNQQDKMNEFGDPKNDMFTKVDFSRFPDKERVFKDKITDMSKFTLLNDFHRAALKNGVKVFFVFPPYPKEAYAQNKTQINNIEKQLVDNLNFKILGNPEDFIYDSVYFSNTCNHLTSDGKKLRTQKIIELLAPYIKRQGKIAHS
jgi:hypothetical protein